MAKRRRRTAKRNSGSEFPGWVWMLFGLGIGLSVAFAIYKRDANRSLPAGLATREPASMAEPLEPPVEVRNVPAVEEPAPEPSRFTFYDRLPNFEVIVPEEEPDVQPDRQVTVVEEPGIYVLQAGSFTEYTDADRRRAQLALLGIESNVQRVAIDDKSYHRVRIGPIDKLDELNRVRQQLRQADIDVLRIRLGE